MPRAKTAALKGIELDETYAEAHAILGLSLSVFDFQRPRRLRKSSSVRST